MLTVLLRLTRVHPAARSARADVKLNLPWFVVRSDGAWLAAAAATAAAASPSIFL